MCVCVCDGVCCASVRYAFLFQNTEHKALRLLQSDPSASSSSSFTSSSGAAFASASATTSTTNTSCPRWQPPDPLHPQQPQQPQHSQQRSQAALEAAPPGAGGGDGGSQGRFLSPGLECLEFRFGVALPLQQQPGGAPPQVAPSGSVTKMTLKDNHLIVVTEERHVSSLGGPSPKVRGPFPARQDVTPGCCRSYLSPCLVPVHPSNHPNLCLAFVSASCLLPPVSVSVSSLSSSCACGSVWKLHPGNVVCVLSYKYLS